MDNDEVMTAGATSPGRHGENKQFPSPALRGRGQG